jgi:hypothetical protein
MMIRVFLSCMHDPLVVWLLQVLGSAYTGVVVGDCSLSLSRVDQDVWPLRDQLPARCLDNPTASFDG